MFLGVSLWWFVGSGKHCIHPQPLTGCFHQFSQGLVGGVATPVLVCRDDRLGCARPARQFGLGQSLPTPDGSNDSCWIHLFSISDCLCLVPARQSAPEGGEVGCGGPAHGPPGEGGGPSDGR